MMTQRCLKSLDLTGMCWESGDIVAEPSPLDNLRSSVCQATLNFLHGDLSNFELDKWPTIDTESDELSGKYLFILLLNELISVVQTMMLH